MQEPALARVPRHFVRVKCGLYIDKVLHFLQPTIVYVGSKLTIDYMALSLQPAAGYTIGIALSRERKVVAFPEKKTCINS